MIVLSYLQPVKVLTVGLIIQNIVLPQTSKTLSFLNIKKLLVKDDLLIFQHCTAPNFMSETLSQKILVDLLHC